MSKYLKKRCSIVLLIFIFYVCSLYLPSNLVYTHALDEANGSNNDQLNAMSNDSIELDTETEGQETEGQETEGQETEGQETEGQETEGQQTVQEEQEPDQEAGEPGQDIPETQGDVADSEQGVDLSENETLEEVLYEGASLSLFGDNPFIQEAGSPYIEPGYLALDGSGADITEQVIVNGSVFEDIGEYYLTYEVMDSKGATITVERKVIVVDTLPPMISLNGESVFYLEPGEEFTDPGAAAVDLYDGDLTETLEVTGNIDNFVPGTYYIKYAVKDSNGNIGEAMRTVIIGTKQLNTVTESGRVTTPDGMGISEVQIDFLPLLEGEAITVLTNDEGYYNIELVPGKYEVTLYKDGFLTIKTSVEVCRKEEESAE